MIRLSQRRPPRPRVFRQSPAAHVAGAPAVARSGLGRRDLDLVLHQIRFDLLALLRNRRARIFTFVFPVAILVIFASVWGDTMVGSGANRGTLTSYYVPGITALGIISATLAGVAIGVAAQREAGILKRRRATPVPAWVLVVGRAVATLAVALGLAVILVGIGRFGFDVTMEATAIPGMLLTAIVGSIAFCCLGYALSTVLTTPDTSAPIVNLALLPLFLISGVYYPNVDFPQWLQDVARAFPVAPLVHGLHEPFASGAHGIAISPVDLGVLVAWGLAGLAVAVRRFSWLPKAAVA